MYYVNQTDEKINGISPFGRAYFRAINRMIPASTLETRKISIKLNIIVNFFIKTPFLLKLTEFINNCILILTLCKAVKIPIKLSEC